MMHQPGEHIHAFEPREAIRPGVDKNEIQYQELPCFHPVCGNVQSLITEHFQPLAALLK